MRRLNCVQVVAWNVCRFATAFCKKCPECAIVTGDGQQPKPSLKPIPVQRPFQIMDGPAIHCTRQQVWCPRTCMFTKWPMVQTFYDTLQENLELRTA